jgi:hypothetical protein
LRSIGIDGTAKYYWGGDPNVPIKTAHWFTEPGTSSPTGGNTTAQFPRRSIDGLSANPYFTFHSTLSVVGSNGSFDPSYGEVEDAVSLIQAVDGAGNCLTGSAANAARVISSDLVAQDRYFGSVCGTTARSALFISQMVPDVMLQGTWNQVSVTFRNIGTTTWTPADLYRLGSQNPQDNYTWGPNRVNLPTSVSPGGISTLDFYVHAPFQPGFYDFQWRMVQDGVEWFGDVTPNIQIEVTEFPQYSSVERTGWIQTMKPLEFDRLNLRLGLDRSNSFKR